MVEVHIVAHNAEEYRDALAARFPELNYHLAHNRNDFADGIEDADVVIAFGTQMSDALFKKNTNLKWIQVLGTGVDGITDQPSLRDDVFVTSMRGIHGPQMAEMAILYMLAFNRHLPWSVLNQTKRKYARKPGTLLEGRTVGILGVGVIGEALAARCKPFGMRIVGVTNRPRALADFDALVARDDLAGAVKEFDYLVVLIPYNAETEMLINTEILAAMKPSAYLINIARGEVIDDDALVAALENDEIAGAALDVFWQEPLPEDHPYWTTKNLILTPHHGGMVEEYGDQAIPLIVHNMESFLAGAPEKMKNLIDHETSEPI